MMWRKQVFVPMSLFLRPTDKNLGAIESRGDKRFLSLHMKRAIFDKWWAANGVRNDFESLRQLFLLEDFKGSLPGKVVMVLNEQKVSTLSRAAVLADEFVLTPLWQIFCFLCHQSPPLKRLEGLRCPNQGVVSVFIATRGATSSLTVCRWNENSKLPQLLSKRMCAWLKWFVNVLLNKLTT